MSVPLHVRARRAALETMRQKRWGVNTRLLHRPSGQVIVLGHRTKSGFHHLEQMHVMILSSPAVKTTWRFSKIVEECVDL